MSQALYRKYRPAGFSGVIGQEHITATLYNQIQSNRIGHAYLFCGSRGVGKTSMARIFAHAINCEDASRAPCGVCRASREGSDKNNLDILEFDAASTNGVDDARELREKVKYPPVMGKYKVYIIDEVHMLTGSAFNALLKTLEEPPAHAVFILATTEPHRLPVTILSRCQRYDFKRITRDGIVRRLREICESLGQECEEEALYFLAQKADGAMRDAISLLDQTVASCSGILTLAAARAASGSLDREFTEDFTERLLRGDGAALLQKTDALFASGHDPSNFIAEIIGLMRDMLLLLTLREPGELLYETEEELTRLRDMAKQTNSQEIILLIRELSRLDNNLKWAVQRKVLFEAGMLQLCDRKWNSEDTNLQQRVQYLEERLSDLTANGLPRTAVSAETAAQFDAAAEPPEEKKELPKKDKQNTVLPQQMTPVDPLDWKDFIAAVSALKKPAVAAILNTGAQGYHMAPNQFIMAFYNNQMKEMIQKQNCLPLFEQAAASAFQKNMHVQLTLQSELEHVKAEEQEEDSEGQAFSRSVSLLNELAEKEGFPVEFKE